MAARHEFARYRYRGRALGVKVCVHCGVRLWRASGADGTSKRIVRLYSPADSGYWIQDDPGCVQGASRTGYYRGDGR